MQCCDCRESITETERKVALTCKGCTKPLHAECAMYSENENAFCEPCHRADAKNWRGRMKAQGVLA